MKTPKTIAPPAAPSASPPNVPLTPEVRAAYEELSASYAAAFDANSDYAFRVEVKAWKTDVDNILEKDAMYRFAANTALLQAILIQIEGTNTDLAKIKTQIAAIADKIALAGDILKAIDKVLTLVPI